jgi:tRNA (mo5U34)-methyltransferase
MNKTQDEIRQRVAELGQWFHNIDLGGVQTAPDHFLGDYPAVKWQNFEHAVPSDLSGKSVLDIGCNGGFYSIQMKLRGADRVVAIDTDQKYLEQARFAAEVYDARIEFKQMSVYQIAQLGEKFDLVLFMGVLYHLRHPLLALDLLHQHVVGDVLVAQSMLRGTTEPFNLPGDLPFWETEVFSDNRFPKMYFVEQRLARDPTNWWIPNRACMEAMLRSAGFRIVAHPEDEVFICRSVAIASEVDPARELEEIRA